MIYYVIGSVLMNRYKKGEMVTGCVTGIEKYGIFVSLDEYYSGLIHISEISYGFVKDVRQVAKNNDLLTAKILSFDKESKHLKLSMKACLERNRYQKITLDPKWNKSQHYGLKDFTPLAEKLNEWIATELEKEEVKK